jgi:hypothetical protein
MAAIVSYMQAARTMAWKLKRNTCLDEAVMEGETDEAGADAGVLADGLADDFPDDELRRGAPPVVVAVLEPVAGRRGQEQHA